MIINTKEWKEFQIQSLFDVRAGKGDSKNTDIGTVPYVSATELNNGIGKFVSCDNSLLEKENTITISRNGSVCECFYHSYPYIASLDDIRVLTPIGFELDQYIAHFIITAILLEKPRYNYGRKFGTERIKNTIIRLPADTKGEPDWAYMRTFIKDTLSQSPLRVQRALKNKQALEQPLHNKATPVLDTGSWKAFRYDEIFEISRGKLSSINELEQGNVPVITATENNNGVSNFLSVEQKYIEKSGCITVSNNGSIAESFYQDSDFSATSDISVLRLKNINLSQELAMFLNTLIHVEKYRFNYGRKWSLDRMQNSVIKLPVDSQGNPDWEFMENYIKTLPYSSSLGQINDEPEADLKTFNSLLEKSSKPVQG